MFSSVFDIVITPHDLFLVGFITFLEGILSIDNAIVLALMARHLPREQQKRALTYGLIGAVVFRMASLGLVTQLMHWRWVRWVGGGYLIFVALRHFFKGGEDKNAPTAKGKGFWATVLMIELMDIAFAVDSILAAVATTNKFWIVFVGGFMGVIMMRFAATFFLAILRRFPRFEQSAYLLILLIGIKLVVEGLHVPGVHFDSPSSPAFLIFWGLMLLALVTGFMPKRHSGSEPEN